MVYEWQIYDLEEYIGKKRGKICGNQKKLLLLLEKQEWRCPLCKRKIENKRLANIDHIIPKAHGGKNTMENYQATHIKCNIKKGSKIL